MKTIKKQFKTLMILIILAFSLNMAAQKDTTDVRVFIRVYNLKGEKISKGYFKFTNEHVIGIVEKRKLIQLNVNEIGYIKTKRTAGHNILMGSIVGLGTGMIVGAATSDQETKTGSTWLFGPYQCKTGNSPGTGAAIGGVIGLAGGGLVGLAGSFIKNSKTYLINGDIKNLRLFAKDISK